jgi:hypothetical protein
MATTPRSRFIATLRRESACASTYGNGPAVVRRVIAVRSRDVILSDLIDGTRGSHLDYPRAEEVTEPEPGRFVVASGDCPILTYDFRPAAIAAAIDPRVNPRCNRAQTLAEAVDSVSDIGNGEAEVSCRCPQCGAVRKMAVGRESGPAPTIEDLRGSPWGRSVSWRCASYPGVAIAAD